jgi:hypothetical protein
MARTVLWSFMQHVPASMEVLLQCTYIIMLLAIQACTAWQDQPQFAIRWASETEVVSFSVLTSIV